MTQIQNINISWNKQNFILIKVYSYKLSSFTPYSELKITLCPKVNKFKLKMCCKFYVSEKKKDPQVNSLLLCYHSLIHHLKLFSCLLAISMVCANIWLISAFRFFSLIFDIGTLGPPGSTVQDRGKWEVETGTLTKGGVLLCLTNQSPASPYRCC